MARTSPLTRKQLVGLGVVVAVSGFLGGAVSSRVFSVPDARAQAAATSSLVVPAQGVVFRSESGNAVGRLTASAAGGALEIYDGQGRVAARLGAGAGGGALDLDNPASGASARLMTTSSGSGLDLVNERGELAVRLAAQTTGGGTVLLRADSAADMRVVRGNRILTNEDPYGQMARTAGPPAQVARK